MARFTWTNVAESSSTAVPWDGGQTFVGSQVLADCNFDGAYQNTFYIACIKHTNGWCYMRVEQRLQRPAFAPAGGNASWRNLSIVESDTTLYPPTVPSGEAETLLGCTVSATFRVGNTNQGVARLVVVMQDSGVLGYSADFSGPFKDPDS